MAHARVMRVSRARHLRHYAICSGIFEIENHREVILIAENVRVAVDEAFSSIVFQRPT
jgi:hypothetical protein